MILVIRTVILSAISAFYAYSGYTKFHPSDFIVSVVAFTVFVLSLLENLKIIRNKKTVRISLTALSYIMVIHMLYLCFTIGFQNYFYSFLSMTFIFGVMFSNLRSLSAFYIIVLVLYSSIILFLPYEAGPRSGLISHYVLFLFILCFYVPLLALRLRNQNKMEREIVEKTRELEEINRFLEEKVADGIRELRGKDALLIQQGKLSAMGEMVANIAHQWKQPLNALGVSIQNLKDYFDRGIMDRDIMNKSVAKSLLLIQHMAHTIDDFRDFFKPDREKKVFDIKDAIGRTVTLIDDSFRNNFIDISVESPIGLKIEGFTGAFSQALLNIFTNAKDAFQLSKTNTEKALVKVRVISRNGFHVITIGNNAGSIDEKVLPRIFEPYFTTKENGSGIGLYMTKMIIETSFGGKVSARNTADGVEFSIDIPITVIQLDP